jgi:UPF0755 protein
MFDYAEENMYSSAKKKKKKTPVIVFSVIILAAALAAFIFYKPYLDDKNGKNQPDNSITFEITETNKSDVPYCLYTKGVIKSVNLFKNYMDKNYGTNFEYQKGFYKINSNMSYEQLGKKFQKPDSVVTKICIPEGKNAYEISQILEDNNLCTSKQFLAALKDNYNYSFTNSIDNTSARPYKLEGYLFPATYEIEKGTSAHDIVDMMLKAMSLRITDDIVSECKNRNITIDEALTMASIIEKECSGYPDEMSTVSSVFWNRLNNPGAQGTVHLGSDPTVKYADLLETQGYAKSIWKGYTTYSCIGLPTGPICSPGTDAIEAAVKPASTKYYYFFTDKNEKFYYFATYKEFQDAWAKI